MNNSEHPTCPKCRAAIPEDAPDGLCPKCALESAATVSTHTTGGGSTPPPTVDEIAPHFPELEIIEMLGAGGMGAVYQARQPQLDRFVALKILSHDLASDPAFVERFNREAKLLARLSHPNIVGVHDFGTAGPYCYLVMEFIDGVNLRQAMQAGRFTPGESLAMVQHLCSALKFAHEEAILHRDIKPENILIDSKGRVKIADFGIAKLVGEDRQHDVTLTMQGSVLGSPHYMAPEQIETPGDVDQRADIYSLGVVLYEMLTGGLPIGRFALPSEKAAMDARIDHIVLRTLEKERDARYQSAQEVLTSVDELKSPASPSQAPSFAPSEERPTAKFSLASAVLTGISLLWGVGCLFLTFMLMMPVSIVVSNAGPGAAEVAESSGPSWLGMMLAGLAVLVLAGTSLPGLILGGKALGDIRESGGRKRGLGLATFGTLAWPVVVLLFLALSASLFVPSAPSGSGIGDQVLFALVVVAAIVAAFLLVRGVVRWAGGVEGENGERRHPGFGGSIVGAVLTAILLPILGSLVAMAFPGKDDDRVGVGIPPTSPKGSLGSSESGNTTPPTPAPEVRWRTGEPELTLPLVLKPGQKAAMRIFMQDGNGDIDDLAGLWEVTARPQYPREHVLRIGTELDGTLHRLVVTKSGLGSVLSRTLEDLRGYDFNKALPAELEFETTGRFDFQLATPGADASKDQGVLTLEVMVSEDPGALSDGGRPATGSNGSEIDWYRGGPELSFPLKIHPAFRAEFRLVQYEGGAPKKIAEIGSWEPPSNPGRKATLQDIDKCLLSIGTVKPKGDRADGTGSVAIQLGPDGTRGILDSDTDFGDWRFETPSHDLPLATAQKYSYRIAKRVDETADQNRAIGELVLEVQLIER